MLHSTIAPPPGIYPLADHLDGALAAGEDLLAVRLAPAADLGPDVAPDAAITGVIQQLRRSEAALLMHLLQARRRASEVAGSDGDLKSVMRLIAAQTGALVDLVETFRPDQAASLVALGDVQQFLRQRGVIADDSAGIGAFQAIEIGAGYKVAGVVEVGPLLDMAASALELLDRRYDLYGAEEDLPAMPAAPLDAAAPGREAPEPETASAASGTNEAAEAGVAAPGGDTAIDGRATGTPAADKLDTTSPETSDGTGTPAAGGTPGSLAAALDALNRPMT